MSATRSDESQWTDPDIKEVLIDFIFLFEAVQQLSKYTMFNTFISVTYYYCYYYIVHLFHFII